MSTVAWDGTTLAGARLAVLHGVRKIAPPWWAFWRKPRWEYVLESESATLRMQKPPSPTA